MKTRLFPKPIQDEYDWAFAHYDQLAQRYPDQWVAFSGRQVVAAGFPLNRVLARARQKTGLPEVPHLFVESGVHFYASLARD